MNTPMTDAQCHAIVTEFLFGTNKAIQVFDKKDSTWHNMIYITASELVKLTNRAKKDASIQLRIKP